jgi:hypothetical protein
MVKTLLAYCLANASFPKKPRDNTDQEHDHNRWSIIQVSHNPHGSFIVRIIPFSGGTFGIVFVLRVALVVIIIIIVVVVSVGIIGWLDIHFENAMKEFL